MPANLDLDSAPADSILGLANAVRRAYLDLAEVSIEHIADGEDDVTENTQNLLDANTRASQRILDAEAALRATLKAQREADE